MNKPLFCFGFFLMITAAMFLVLALLFVAYRPEVGIPAVLLDLGIMYLGVNLLIQGKRGADETLVRPCSSCGRSLPTRALEFKECRCYLVMRREREVQGFLCAECAEKIYSQFQKETALKGWWSMPGLLRTPMLLMFNRVYLSRARAMSTHEPVATASN